jgi:peptidoglycan DL-endopeptidase RipA
MPKRLGLIVLFGIATMLVLAGGITAGAAPSDEVQSKEAEIAAAQERLMEIRMEAGIANEAYSNALYEMNQLNGEIASAEREHADAEERLAAAQRSLEERASQVYKSGNVAFVDVLVGVDSFSEFAARMNLWLEILEEERAQFEAVREATDELAARKAELEEERAKRVETVTKAADLKERASEAETEAEEYLASLNAGMRDAIQAEQARQAQRAAERAAADAEE